MNGFGGIFNQFFGSHDSLQSQPRPQNPSPFRSFDKEGLELLEHLTLFMSPGFLRDHLKEGNDYFECYQINFFTENEEWHQKVKSFTNKEIDQVLLATIVFERPAIAFVPKYKNP